MYTRLTIFNKGLLLIVTPLVIQAVYLGMLIQTHAEAARTRRWAVHTKEVIATTEEVYRRLLEGYAGIRILVAAANPTASQPFRRALEQMPAKIEGLRKLVSDNQSQGPRIAQLNDQSQTLLDWIALEERLTTSGQRGEALDRLDEGARLLEAVRATTDQILGEEARLDSQRMERMSRSTARQVWTLVGGGVALLGTTLVLALVFLNGVIDRLAILRDNACQFAEGKALEPPLAGRDEIAVVDHAFHEMADRLNQQKQENEMFVYSVSHDLRSPLINLQGFSEELSRSYRELESLFRRDDVPPSVRHAGQNIISDNIEESIGYIQTAVGRLARIIDALLRLSRAGRVEYQLQTLDVAPIIHKIVSALHDTITDRKAEIKIGELPPAWGDPTVVEQIFANLIGNAVNYLDPRRPGKIEIGGITGPVGNRMRGLQVYYVKDNGLGIPEAYHQRVFTPFSRLQANVQQGEGIGLAVVRRMVQRHGGKIWLESTAGVGTTFFVALPSAAPDRAQPDFTEKPPGAEIPHGDSRIWQPSPS
jgi:signal transduction histidine kinase